MKTNHSNALNGPGIAGTRLTVYNLLPYFLDPTATESYLCQLYGLTPEQIAAARAYVLNNLDSVLAQHLKIEARMAAGNPPDVIEKAEQTRNAMQKFKEWLDKRRQDEAAEVNGSANAERFPTFREWFAQQQRAEGH